MSEFSEIIGNFLQCDANTGYDVVQLMTALDLDSSQHSLDN